MTTPRAAGQRRRPAGGGSRAGDSVVGEVDMAAGDAGGHQPATLRPADQAASAGDALRDAVMAGHRGDVALAAGLLGHDDPAVRAAALGALARAEALDPAVLGAAIAEAHPSVRRRACLLAGRALAADAPGAAALVAVLTGTLSNETDASVVEVAAWALGEAGAG